MNTTASEMCIMHKTEAVIFVSDDDYHRRTSLFRRKSLEFSEYHVRICVVRVKCPDTTEVHH